MLKRVARHLNTAEVPRVSLVVREDGGRELVLEGCWTLALLGAHLAALNALLAAHTQQPGVVWNCLGIARMDSAGAMTIWRAWGRHLPEHVQASPEHLHIFERIAQVEQTPPVSVAPVSPLVAIMQVGKLLLVFGGHAREFVSMIGQLVLDFLHLLRSPAEIPRREISANLYKSGVKAMPVTALVGFLIGIVMSYLSALQLKQFGGEVFIVNILGMSIIRELGPVLVAVLVAGRSGSAMTAQLGVMRVTEEIDALATMGVSHSLRLIFPKVLALAVVMPLLVLWLSSVALLGGMVAAQMQLDISYGYFFETLPRVVPLANLWIGLVKGLVFGIMVALVACHFGLRVKPNTESLSANTTASVVAAITLAILLDAIIAIVTRKIGMFY
ncbi:MAG: hypothetical protein RL695_2031 [Pseudomonadota bacterium]